MKNLVNQVDKLRRSLAPGRMKFWHFLKGESLIYAQKEYNYNGRCLREKTAARIIKGSVGKPVKDVYAKVKPLVMGLGDTPREFWRDYVTIFSQYNSRGETVVFGTYGEETTVGTSNYYKYRDIWEQEGYLYDIRYAITYPESRVYTRFDARKHYSYQTERRKSHKDYRKYAQKMGDIALKLINKPNVFAFYKKLFEEKKYLDEKEVKCQRMLREEAKPNSYRAKRDRYRRFGLLSHWTKEDIQRREDIVNDISNIDQGNYSMYFRSSAYMYSFQKECPHIAPTPHLPAPIK